MQQNISRKDSITFRFLLLFQHVIRSIRVNMIMPKYTLSAEQNISREDCIAFSFLLLFRHVIEYLRFNTQLYSSIPSPAAWGD